MRTIGTSLFLLMATCTFAQVDRFEAGIQIGAGSNALNGNRSLDKSDRRIAPLAGITLQYNFSERLGLRLGADYQPKGANTDVLFTDINGNIIAQGKAHSTLDYITLPLQLRFSHGGRVRLSIGAGGYAGFLLKATDTYPIDGPLHEVNTTADLKNMDFGLSGSLGASMRLSGQLSVAIEARYDHGLANISALPTVDNGGIHTSAACVLLGCTYRFGGAM